MSYQKLPIAAKRTLANERMRDRACECPRCHSSVMPTELAEHMAERCSGERPPPPSFARWLSRVEALRLVTAPMLDAWAVRGLVRMRSDGRFLERDLTIASAWARALECR